MKLRDRTKWFIALLALGSIVLFTLKKCNAIKRHSAEEAMAILEKEHKVTIDKLGREIASAEQIIRNKRKLVAEMDDMIKELESTNLSKANELRELRQVIKSQAKRIKDMGGKIESLTRVIAEGTTTIRDTFTRDSIVYRDKVTQVWGIQWQDQWASIDGKIYPDLGKYELTPKFNMSFTHTTYEKDGKWLTDIIFDSPYASVESMQGFDFQKKVKVEPKKWGIGISAGVNYNLKPIFGITLNRNIIRF